MSPLHYSEPITHRPAECKLVWAPNKKLYGFKVKNMADEALSKPEWAQLPLAYLQHVYQPFPERLHTVMTYRCADEYNCKIIVPLLFEMEQYGPVHTKDTACTEPLHAFIKKSMSEDAFLALLVRAPLRSAALLEDDPSYPDYALPTSICWVKTCQRMHHQPSNTWRAGPDGFRWIIAIYIHFASAFSVYKNFPTQLPTDSFGSWLEDSIKETISILKRTFRERAGAWQEAVVAAYLAHPDKNIGNESIMSTDLDVMMGPDDADAQRLAHHVQCHLIEDTDDSDSELSDSDSTSGESIDILDFDSTSKEGDSQSVNQEQAEDQTVYDVSLYQSLIHSQAEVGLLTLGGEGRKGEYLREYEGRFIH
ncbi:hypothetical protein FRC11_014986 [Ceratobasidium sp. 423]|nr:hypothetical protein FRC11_014986 [Ceratobasidium sp. 423]